ncbi:fumarylacetoacetate hydrolase family protein [Alteromonas flava]|uniref:fumarylacetoacetate hydrolase family protein n=1 Tax=Alteromonas flava TaxID=2048003 RepID=UPI000C2827A7|nr:fumarylacetoacetate hydrolase family protein [Alteromonas flava]
MSYQHHWYSDHCPILSLPVGKVVCVGRNYVAHAKELGNPVPDAPVLFMKPSTSIQFIDDTFCLCERQEAYHYETEIAVLIGQSLTNASPTQVQNAVVGIGLALDLTLRATQNQLKSAQQPWERAKGFDGACPITPFLAASQFSDWENITFQLAINEKPVQDGNSADMLFPIATLLGEISQNFTLLPGDVVLTGTPAGVGELHDQDKLRLSLGDKLTVTTRCCIGAQENSNV